MGIHQVLQGQAAVDESLHRLTPVAIRIPLDPGGVVGHLIDHLPVGGGKIEVVLEKIAMGINMGHHQLLVDQVVAFQEVGITGIVVDHHLIDFG
jgi:hypothetical protein